MNEIVNSHGIEGRTTPELRVSNWVDGKGNKLVEAPTLLANSNAISVVYCFQSWCPGCHKTGFPSLQRMVRETETREGLQFLAIQTVFEGHESNTFERMLEVQREYELEIPFGHDQGDLKSNRVSHTMTDFRTGGTPWFIIINENGKVIFNDFHLNTDNAIAFLKGSIEV